LHSAEIIVGKRVLGRERHCAHKCLPRSLEVVLGPLKVPEIPVRVLQERVQADGLLVLGTSLGVLAQASEDDPSKIVDSRVVRVLAFGGGKFHERCLGSILL
jgi:hypothetical protein